MNATAHQVIAGRARAGWRDFLALAKPRVVALIAFCALAGMLLADPAAQQWGAVLGGLLGIALLAGAAAACNHVADRAPDARMARTRHRPLPGGRLRPAHALAFAAVLGGAGFALLWTVTHPVTAWLTLGAAFGYAVVYTRWLKPATPQNVVIGGLAGAMPPLIGWSAIAGGVTPEGLLLALIIYTWTPAHFWALALARREEYARAGIPMLPVTHGPALTRLYVLLYAVLLLAVSVLPYALRMSGAVYLAGAVWLGARFVHGAAMLFASGDDRRAAPLFRASIRYLTALFALLLVDHWLARFVA